MHHRRVQHPDNSLRYAAAVAAAVLFILLFPVTVSAANDTVVTDSGDRVTGEVKGLEQGQLEVKTNTMSTVYIKWTHVAEIRTDTSFEVETNVGERHLGRLEPAGPGRIVIIEDGGRVEVDYYSVVRMRPIKESFWKKISGGINLGASYTKSSDIGQGSLSANATFRRPGFELGSSLSSALTVDTNKRNTSRSLLEFDYARLLEHRWLLPGIVQFEHNTDQGLDLRTLLGGGVGRFLVQSNRQELIVTGGAVVTRERPIEGDTTKSLEALLSARYSFFTYDTPKTNILIRPVLYPSLSDWGRVRFGLDVTATREIVKDFTFGISGYHTYDNRPPTEGAATTDYGVSLTLGLTF